MGIIGLMTVVSVEAQYFSYGAKLGLGFPGFQNEQIASEKITPNLSLLGNLHITRDFLLQTELAFEMKGNKFTYEVWDETTGKLIEDSVYTVKTNMNYATIPLFFKVNIGRNNKFYFQAGGYYAYMLNARYSGKVHQQMFDNVNIRPGLSPHDLGLIVGGGMETPVRRGLSMLLDVKYNYGMKDLNLDPAITLSDVPMKTRSFIMSIGVVIDVE